MKSRLTELNNALQANETRITQDQHRVEAAASTSQALWTMSSHEYNIVTKAHIENTTTSVAAPKAPTAACSSFVRERRGSMEEGGDLLDARRMISTAESYESDDATRCYAGCLSLGSQSMQHLRKRCEEYYPTALTERQA